MVRIIFHVYPQLLSGPKTVWDPSGFFRIEEMIDVDIYAFERLYMEGHISMNIATRILSSASLQGLHLFALGD